MTATSMSSTIRHPGATDLDVCLLNGRRYVQATQMMARASELLQPEGACLTQAKFARLTHRSIRAVPAGSTDNPSCAIGSVQFRHGDRQVAFHLLESNDDAPRRQRTPRATVTAIRDDRALSGEFSFRCEKTLEGALDALVLGIKSMHEALGPATTDVWFTGLRSFALPLAMSGFDGRGAARVTRLRMLRNPPHDQSLMRVVIDLAGVQSSPFEGLVTFAFNAGGAIVD